MATKQRDPWTIRGTRIAKPPPPTPLAPTHPLGVPRAGYLALMRLVCAVVGHRWVRHQTNRSTWVPACRCHATEREIRRTCTRCEAERVERRGER